MSAPTAANDAVLARAAAAGLPPRLHEVTLDVRAGEVLALVGPNGAGKSTLLALLAGDLAPAHGEVTLCGEAAARTDGRTLARRRAVLGQHADAPVALDVATVLGLARIPWAGGRERPADAAPAGCAPPELLAALELAPLLGRTMAALAGGERQRVQIARVCAQLWGVRPALLLLDEPANHLDLRHQRALVALLRGCAAAGQAVVVAVHDLNLALALADRVALLAHGRVLGVGLPRAVLHDDALAQAFGLAPPLLPLGDRVLVDVFGDVPPAAG